MAYDDWKMDDGYDDYDRGDWVHINDVPDLDGMKQDLQALVNELYTNDGANFDQIEAKLEVLCDQIGVKLPEGRMKWKQTA